MSAARAPTLRFQVGRRMRRAGLCQLVGESFDLGFEGLLIVEGSLQSLLIVRGLTRLAGQGREAGIESAQAALHLLEFLIGSSTLFSLVFELDHDLGAGIV